MKTYIKYPIYFVILILLFSDTLTAQNKLDKAREYKDNYQYSQAIALYSSRFKSATPRRADDIKDIAHCYMMMNDMNSAQKWLSKINSFSVYSPDEMVNYAISLKSSGDYESAINQYRRIADFFPEKTAKIEEWIQSCKTAEEWMTKPIPYEIENVDNLNSEYSDFGLIPYKNGFMFSSDRKIKDIEYTQKEIFGWTGNPYLRFFNFAGIEENTSLASPVLSQGINSDFHNGPGIFDEKSGIMYFTLTKMQKEKSLPTNSDPTSWVDYSNTEKYVNRLEIYSAKLTDNRWADVLPFEYNNSDKYSVGHPALSPDGNVLYFVSNMPGGYGNSDIYFCKKLPNGHWSSPKNAGKVINSEGKEAFPIVDKDGTFYFSSDGFSGMGGLDIFKTQGNCDSWSTPENLKYPINSPRDDFSPYFTETGEAGYLSSNRDGGKGEDDIYYFSKRLILVGTVKTYLKDKSLVTLSGADIKIENLSQAKSENRLSDNNGLFIEKAGCGTSYKITASKKGYLMQSKDINAICNIINDTLHVEFVLDKLMENKSYVLDNIYYDFDKWNIRPDAALELDKLVNVLKENPEIDIELGSHTDARGTVPYNKNLSQKRAESAVDYIISKGIGSGRITAKGYGESKLRNQCSDGVTCSDGDHQLNRRTEFTVTKIHDSKRK